jgi:hypothetical protein
MQISKLKVGREQCPVLLVDNFIPQPGSLVDYAAGQRYLANSPYYPGVRAPAPEAYRHFMLQQLQQTLIDYFELPATSLGFSVCHFSLVTTKPEQLKLLQRIPHFDTTEKHALAAVHYLFQGDQGGTAFYRHKKTGFEYIDQSRTEAYYRSLESENDGPDLPKATEGYIQGDTALFEQTGQQTGLFNRLVIYRRHMLHSGLIQQNTKLSADPRIGRLTISSFIDCRS